MNWTIRKIDYDVKEEIMKRAAEAQMSVPEYLAVYFSDKQPKPTNNDVWYIRGVPRDTKIKLKKLAAVSGRPIAQVLVDLLKDYRGDDTEVKIAKADADDFAERLKNLEIQFKKIVDN